jgi:hypothetical protein
MLLHHTLAVLLISFAQEQQGPIVKVRAYDQAGAGSSVIEKAQRRVTFIFDQIGIRTQWVADEHPRFRILVVQKTDERFREDMFGYTPRDPDGTSSGLAYVRYNAISAFVRITSQGRPPLDAADMLAYCMAHELGHLLLPAGSHSRSGIMSPRWRENDFILITTGNLFFSSDEGKRMRQAVTRLSRD